MNLAGLRFGSLRDAVRDRVLAAAQTAQPTYAHLGSTLDPDPSADPGIREQHLDLGLGAAAFARARIALQTWVPHTGIGATVEPAGQPVEVGATVLVVLRQGPVYVLAPNRVVAVVDEPRHYAFAYGTLPGHPARGEESFEVEHLGDDTVRITIRIQAVGGTIPARALGPAVRLLQAAAVDRYLRAVASYVRSPTG